METPDPSQLQNAIQGGSTLLDLNKLEKQWIVGQATAWIDFRTSAASPHEKGGTGFVLPGGWLLTSRHVIPTPDQARAAIAIFGYKRDLDGRR